MTRVFGSLASALTVVVGLAGCRPHELGDKAVAFGSSADVSNTAGFLEGRWLRKVDESTMRSKRLTPKLWDPGLYIEFHRDHTCREYGHGNVVHMTWKEASNGVDLTVLDVDGYSPGAIKAGSVAEDAWNERAPSRHLTRTDMGMRQMSLYAATKRLELMPDKKRLFNPATLGADGTSRLGTETWVRVK